ncbi:MAG: hypothetical protein COB12_07370 [Flavobacterium sp.]|nr:MAG: hypothetical protein COB12_07370 [Flavobacterium sp.]
MSICIHYTNAQNSIIDSLLNNYRFSEAKDIASSLTHENTKNLTFAFIYSTEKNIDSSFYFLFNVDTLQLDNIEKAKYYNYLATTFDSNNEEDIAFEIFKKAQYYYQINHNNKDYNKINLELYHTLNAQENYNYTKDEYLTIFEKNAKENNYNDQLTDLYLEKALNHFIPSEKDSVNYYLKKAFYYNKKDGDELMKARIHGYKGLYFAEVINELDSADYHYSKALLIEQQYPVTYRVFYTYINQASALQKRNKPLEAIALLKKADSIPQTLYRKNNYKFLYGLLANNYEDIGDNKEALFYLKKHLAYRDSTNIVAQNVNLTKFQAEKKENENIILQAEVEKKQRQQRNLWIGGIITLLFGSVFGILVYKNTKRKQLIAEQEREIEIQKKEKLLKDQELNTIDAMIEGQEKERQRLASDLHDSVGATLSAARLQFEHLCKYKGSGILKNEDELYTKTGKLLEQVYQEIRSMAHLKNSGVIATKGLLPAIQKLARNASTPGNLQIEVDDYGLSKKIENSLEISIFRVIQELITNIIKHAKATEATISITQHEDSLSIIVEDNGVGFDVKKSINKDGMGLSSIEKRIEHLEGSMEVDSNIGKGTNILIDIPL